MAKTEKFTQIWPSKKLPTISSWNLWNSSQKDILIRLLDTPLSEHLARILFQNHVTPSACKNLAYTCKNLARILPFFTLQESCKIMFQNQARILHVDQILARSWKDLGKILHKTWQDLGKILAKFLIGYVRDVIAKYLWIIMKLKIE